MVMSPSLQVVKSIAGMTRYMAAVLSGMSYMACSNVTATVHDSLNDDALWKNYYYTVPQVSILSNSRGRSLRRTVPPPLNTLRLPKTTPCLPYSTTTTPLP